MRYEKHNSMTIQEKVEKTIIKLRKEQGMSQETFAYALPLIQVVNFNKTHDRNIIL